MAKRRQPFTEPSNVAADSGIVIVDGPDGVAYSMVPDAAEETSHRMLAAATTAQGQRLRGLARDRSDQGDEASQEDGK